VGGGLAQAPPHEAFDDLVEREREWQHSQRELSWLLDLRERHDADHADHRTADEVSFSREAHPRRS